MKMCIRDRDLRASGLYRQMDVLTQFFTVFKCLDEPVRQILGMSCLLYTSIHKVNKRILSTKKGNETNLSASFPFYTSAYNRFYFCAFQSFSAVGVQFFA